MVSAETVGMWVRVRVRVRIVLVAVRVRNRFSMVIRRSCSEDCRSATVWMEISSSWLSVMVAPRSFLSCTVVFCPRPRLSESLSFTYCTLRSSSHYSSAIG